MTVCLIRVLCLIGYRRIDLRIYEHAEIGLILNWASPNLRDLYPHFSLALPIWRIGLGSSFEVALLYCSGFALWDWFVALFWHRQTIVGTEHRTKSNNKASERKSEKSHWTLTKFNKTDCPIHVINSVKNTSRKMDNAKDILQSSATPVVDDFFTLRGTWLWEIHSFRILPNGTPPSGGVIVLPYRAELKWKKFTVPMSWSSVLRPDHNTILALTLHIPDKISDIPILGLWWSSTVTVGSDLIVSDGSPAVPLSSPC